MCNIEQGARLQGYGGLAAQGLQLGGGVAVTTTGLVLEGAKCRCHEEADACERGLQQQARDAAAAVSGACRLQQGLLALVGLLTVHSIYFVQQASADPYFNLGTAPRSQAALFVWSSGWISAVCSGLGVAPFLLVSRLSDSVVAASNAVAAGVMIAASIGLVGEGAFDAAAPDATLPPAVSVIIGFWLGVLFIKVTEYLVRDVEPDKLADASSKRSLARVLVIMAAMTVHSFSEGVGIGVSHRSQSLGGVVSASLAIHNIPEGLACAVVLIPRGFSLVSTALWCIFSSLPQPLLAVPSFLLVDVFTCVTPIGCAFAAGAMTYVAFFELLKEAHEAMPVWRANLVAACAMLAMGLAQVAIKHNFQLS